MDLVGSILKSEFAMHLVSQDFVLLIILASKVLAKLEHFWFSARRFDADLLNTQFE